MISRVQNSNPRISLVPLMTSGTTAASLLRLWDSWSHPPTYNELFPCFIIDSSIFYHVCVYYNCPLLYNPACVNDKSMECWLSSVIWAGMWQLRVTCRRRRSISPFSPSGLWPGPQNREGSGRKKVKNMKSLVVLLLCVGLLTIYTGRKLSGIHLRRAAACHIQLWGDLWIKIILSSPGFRSVEDRTERGWCYFG